MDLSYSPSDHLGFHKVFLGQIKNGQPIAFTDWKSLKTKMARPQTGWDFVRPNLSAWQDRLGRSVWCDFREMTPAAPFLATGGKMTLELIEIRSVFVTLWECSS